MTTVEVHLGSGDTPTRVGSAFVSLRRGTVTTTFQYNAAYLATPGCWEVSPDLPLAGRSSTSGLPGAIADSAPDRWGRYLIKKRLQSERRVAVGAAAAVTEVDFLLNVSDTSRQGALRYRTAGSGGFLADNNDVPKLVSLPALLNAADMVARSDPDEMAAIKLLLDAGSASLGGARPKASIRDGDRLLIAKFPHHGDQWDVMAWEMTALDLAEASGIAAPNRQLVDVGGKQVLLVERFDRQGAERIGYSSGMTMLRSAEGIGHDYVELAEALAERGRAVDRDLKGLWRRIAFSVAVHNTDDHMRNHGFVGGRGGWELSPMFDVNPNPDMSVQRATSIGYETRVSQEREALLSIVDEFGLQQQEATTIWDEVASGVASWSDVASRHGILQSEQTRFSEVFERW